MASGLDVADVDQTGQRGRPQPGEWAAAGVQGQMILAVEPTRRHHPAVFAAVHVPFLRVRVGVLVPRMAPVDRITQRVRLDEHLLFIPVVVIRTAQKDSDSVVEVAKSGRPQLAVDNNPGCDEHGDINLGIRILLGSSYYDDW